jgi:O-antigen/teichoic acid export membrane protein
MQEPEMLRRLTRDSGVYLAGKAVPAGLGLLTVLLLVRLFGREVYGRYSVVLAISLLVSALTSGWLIQGILRFYPGSPTSARGVLTDTVTRIGIAAIGVGAVLTMVILALTPTVPWIDGVLGIAVFVGAFRLSLWYGYAQADLQPRLRVQAEFMKAAIALSIPLIAWFAGWRTVPALLVGAGLGYALPTIFLARHHPWASKQFDRDVLIRLWTYGWPLGIWFAMAQVFAASDRYVVAFFLGYEDAGTYAAVYDLVAKTFAVGLMPVLLAAHPLLMQAWNRGHYRGAKILLLRSMLYHTALALLGVVVAWVLAPTLIRLMFGTVDQEAIRLVVPIAIGASLWLMALLVHKPLEMASRTRIMLVNVLVCASINLGANLYLIPRFGYVAAAYTTILGAVIYYGLSVVTGLSVITGARALRAASSDGIPDRPG